MKDDPLNYCFCLVVSFLFGGVVFLSVAAAGKYWL